MGSEAWNDAEQIEMVSGGSRVGGEKGADVDIGSADKSVGNKLVGTNTGTDDGESWIDHQSANAPCGNEDRVAESNGDANDNRPSNKDAELADSSAMTDGDGDVIMDDRADIHGLVKSLDSVPPPESGPLLNTSIAPPPVGSSASLVSTCTLPVSTPTPCTLPISTPTPPIDRVESASVHTISQGDGKLVGYSSSTPLSSEMN